MLHRIPAAITLFTVLLLATAGNLTPGLALSEPTARWQAKVDPVIIEQLARSPAEPAEFLVFLAEQADLSAAARLPNKREKGKYVYEALTAVAARTQGPVVEALARRGAAYRPFWVANMIWVRGDGATVQAVAQRGDVAHVFANPAVRLQEPTIAFGAQAINQPSGIELTTDDGVCYTSSSFQQPASSFQHRDTHAHR
jgi:hypothetical protein